MIDKIETNNPKTLSDLFTNQLRHSGFRTAWKIAKCVPILKPGKTDLTTPKNLQLISLLSCLGKTLEGILAHRIAEAAEICGALTYWEFGCKQSLSAIDALITTITPTEEWLKHNSTHKTKVNRPTIMTNAIDGAFNCVRHDKVRQILEPYRLPESLVNTIADFTTDRYIDLEFDGNQKTPVPFVSELPQGSPLSPILFVIYPTAVSRYQPTGEQITATYIDDEVMVPGSKTTYFATKILQERLDQQLSRAPCLNIRYAPTKPELMHTTA